jgi:hypothetical protein
MRLLQFLALIQRFRFEADRGLDVSSDGRNVPAAGALAVGARARVPDRFVRHDVWLERGELWESLLYVNISFEAVGRYCGSWRRLHVQR